MSRTQFEHSFDSDMQERTDWRRRMLTDDEKKSRKLARKHGIKACVECRRLKKQCSHYHKKLQQLVYHLSIQEPVKDSTGNQGHNDHGGKSQFSSPLPQDIQEALQTTPITYSSPYFGHSKGCIFCETNTCDNSCMYQIPLELPRHLPPISIDTAITSTLSVSEPLTSCSETLLEEEPISQELIDETERINSLVRSSNLKEISTKDLPSHSGWATTWKTMVAPTSFDKFWDQSYSQTKPFTHSESTKQDVRIYHDPYRILKIQEAMLHNQHLEGIPDPVKPLDEMLYLHRQGTQRFIAVQPRSTQKETPFPSSRHKTEGLDFFSGQQPGFVNPQDLLLNNGLSPDHQVREIWMKA